MIATDRYDAIPKVELHCHLEGTSRQPSRRCAWNASTTASR